jgi:uncharacterized protein (DUF362 family)/ferredoxin
MSKTASIVSLQRVQDYDSERVLAALRICLEPLGGMGAFIRPGQRVLLKPNLLGGFPAERAVTTHPMVVRAAAILALEAGGRVCVGDSCAVGSLHSVAQGCGLEPVLSALRVPLLDCSEEQVFDVPGGIIGPRLVLTRALAEVDVVITLPKFKTHGQMIITGALKNQYGLIPGALKGQWHFRLQQPEWLSALILDINRVARPVLGIMDAVVAMEGAGPSGGTPRFIGALAASPDLAALDTILCHVVGQDPMRVPLLAAAKKHQFGRTTLEEIQNAGSPWREFAINDFRKIEHPVDVLQMLPLPRPALRWMRRQWTARPVINEDLCTRCGVCERGCPVEPSAIHPQEPRSRQLNDSLCIRCYCCHEFCPHGAIDMRRSWSSRLLPLTSMANGAARLLGFLASRQKK